MYRIFKEELSVQRTPESVKSVIMADKKIEIVPHHLICP